MKLLTAFLQLRGGKILSEKPCYGKVWTGLEMSMKLLIGTKVLLGNMSMILAGLPYAMPRNFNRQRKESKKECLMKANLNLRLLLKFLPQLLLHQLSDYDQV